MKRKAKPATDAEMLREIEALKQLLAPPPRPAYTAPGELWPGESLDPNDPGRFLLA